jgi:hypothetical protein
VNIAAVHFHHESFDFAQDEEKLCAALAIDATHPIILTLSEVEGRRMLLQRIN